VVEDAAILCGLGLIYLSMLAMIIGLGRILAGEDRTAAPPHEAARRGG
jgi:hypothetical protein